MLALYLVGARDDVPTRSQNNADYFTELGYGPAQIEHSTDYPVLPAIFCEVNIINGLSARILLLLRARWATAWAFIAATSQMILMVISFEVYESVASARNAFASAIDIVIWGLTVGLLRRLRLGGHPTMIDNTTSKIKSDTERQIGDQLPGD
jgi:hypothetical protein